MKKTYHHIQEFTHKTDGTPGLFCATITTVSAAEDAIWAGLSIVGKGDKFCRKTGRELAEKRALEAIKNYPLYVGQIPKNLPPMTAFFGSVEDFKLFMRFVRDTSQGIDVLKSRFKVR